MTSHNSCAEHNVAAIRELLRDAFTDKELGRFFQDRPIFRQLVSQFGSGFSHEDMIDATIRYCNTHLMFPDLLAEIEKYNPRQHERYRARCAAEAREASALRIILPEGEYSCAEWTAVGGTGAHSGWRILLVNQFIGRHSFIQPGSAVPDANGCWLHSQCHLLATGRERFVYALGVAEADTDRVHQLCGPEIRNMSVSEERLTAAGISYTFSPAKRLIRLSDEEVESISNTVRIIGLDCRPDTIYPTQTVELAFTIVNEKSQPQEVWLGASVLDELNHEHFNVDQDEVCVLAPGRGVYKRFLTIPRTASPGNYRLVGAAWVGEESQPAKSWQIARMDRGRMLCVS